MPSRSLNQIKNSINSYEYDDELLIAIDFGTVTDDHLSADVIDDTLIVSYNQQNASDQDIEFSLPDQFTNPTVKINNGVITISQSLTQELDADEMIEESEDEPEDTTLDTSEIVSDDEDSPSDEETGESEE